MVMKKKKKKKKNFIPSGKPFLPGSFFQNSKKQIWSVNVVSEREYLTKSLCSLAPTIITAFFEVTIWILKRDKLKKTVATLESFMKKIN